MENIVTLLPEDKPLAYGISSTVYGELFKIEYEVQLTVKHSKVKHPKNTKADAIFPIVVMTPNHSIMRSYVQKIKKHPFWKPHEYKQKEFYFTQEFQEEFCPYGKFISWLIGRETNLYCSK